MTTLHDSHVDWIERKRAAGRYRYALGRFMDNAPIDHPARAAASQLALAVAGCGRILITEHQSADDAGKVSRAFSCGHRLCPRCAPELGAELRARIGDAVDATFRLAARGELVLPSRHQASKKPKNQRLILRGIELTLTMRNCRWSDLPEAVERLQAAFVRLLRRQDVARHMVGAVRAIEITRGRDRLAHPHIHAVLLVDEQYFCSGYVDKFDRITWLQCGPVRAEKRAPWTPIRCQRQPGWIRMWREALGVDYDPSVWAKTCESGRRSRGAVAVREGVDQALKYALKLDDDEPGGEKKKKKKKKKRPLGGDELAWIAAALKGRRRVEAYGCLRDLVAADKPEARADDDLVEEDAPAPIVRCWRWSAAPKRDSDNPKRDGTYILHREVCGAQTWLAVQRELADVWPQPAWQSPTTDAASQATPHSPAFPPGISMAERDGWVEHLAHVPDPHPGASLHRAAHQIARDLNIPDACDRRSAFVRLAVARWESAA